VYGLIYIAIPVISASLLVHMVFLGAIYLVAGGGLMMKEGWSTSLMLLGGPLGLIFGVASLYSSIKFLGFGSNTQILLVNLSLLGLILIAVGLFIYAITDRWKVPKSSMR